MIIREEKPQDYPAVDALIRSAFAHAAHSDGPEQDLVAALRDSDAFLPPLSLLAEEAGMVIGYILFTKVNIGDGVALALAPLAVLPAFQMQGVGKALVREGHRCAANLGYGLSVVLGSETYYPQFGYLPAADFGIVPPFEVDSKNYMVCRLREDAAALRGTVRYAKAFDL